MAELGRPTVMTPETIGKLEEGFLMGFSDRQASLYANINPDTLYAYCKNNPDFSERKELLKEDIKLRAKKNIHEAIIAKDKSLSQWYLERREADFKPKSESDTKGHITVQTISFDPSTPVQVPPTDVPASGPQSS